MPRPSANADASGVSDETIAEEAGVELVLVRAWLDENNDIRVVAVPEGKTRLVKAVMHPDSGV